MPEKSSTFLVIGYGNTLRSDDGAGQRVAEIIAQKNWENVRVFSLQQLTPELAEEIANSCAVFFVDAMPSDADSVLVKPLEAAALEKDWGHTINPRSLLYLSQSIYGLVPPAWWILIPGSNFDFGEFLSPITEKCLDSAIEKMSTAISQMSANVSQIASKI
jgi:hydrogenase maturation protease